MKRLWNYIDGFIEKSSVILLSFMCFFILLQVVYRFIFHDSKPWTEEIARYLFMWLTYCGAALAMKNGAHLRMDFLLTLAKGRVRKALMFISDACMSIYCFMGIILGVQLLMEVMEMQQTFLSLDISLWGVYVGIPLFFLLTFLQSIRKLFIDSMTQE
ncbi:TRAP transporter small permease [uncultured Mailhella sp.]|uniref:TRAP transporter small permease n=1 Tax=uncultured Mailhella sp. TaxID=1981031 RepID=UPI0025EFCFDE|nr:TRAP transporter small permease [uncultured Mailhella sp.]